MHPARPATQGNKKGQERSRSLEEIEERRPLALIRGLCRGEAAARNHVSVCRRRREGDNLSSTSECEFPTNLHIFYCYHFQNLGAGGARRRRCGGGGGGGGRGRVPLLRPPPPVPHPAAEPLQGAAGVARGRVRLRAGRRVSQEGGGGGGGRIIAGGGGGILQDDGGREVRDNFLTE